MRDRFFFPAALVLVAMMVFPGNPAGELAPCVRGAVAGDGAIIMTRSPSRAIT